MLSFSPEVVRLKIGGVGRMMEAHIFGAGFHIFSERKWLTVGTAR